MRKVQWIGLLLLIFSPSLLAQLPPPGEQPPAEQPKAEQPTPTEQPPATEETKEAVEAVEKAVQKGDLGEEVFRIVVDGKVDLNYVFAESPDSFVVTYKVHLEGQVKNQVDIVKGKGEVTTGIEGFLAKWPTGNCSLNISVGEIPFEMVFNKTEEEKIRLDIRLIGDVLEKWESNCSFIDAPGAKFKTSGTPEQWVIRALKRPIPSLLDLTIPIDRLHKRTSTLPFEIESFLIPDPPLGSAELKGKGTIQVIPERL